jgi:tetratricopeptide (TPR) repeat protein
LILKKVFALALLLLLSSALRADGTVTLFSASKVGQPWLEVSVDPRSAALGDALVASSGDIQALRINPAGLQQMNDSELAFTHNEFDSDLGLRQEYLAYGRRLGEGGLGLALNYFSFGTFDNRDINGALMDNSSDSAFSLSAGYGEAFFGDSLLLGADLEGSQQAISGSISNLYTLGLGAQWQLASSFALGAAALGLPISSSMQGASAPGSLQAGAAWTPLARTLVLGAEYFKPSQADGGYHAGIEWNFLQSYSLRAGYRSAAGDAAQIDSGFSLGAGLKLGPLQLDYAYVPYGNFDRAQRLGLTLDLSQGLFGGNIVIESTGITQNAQAEYGDGLKAYKGGDWYMAKADFTRALQIYPQFEKAGEMKVMMEDIEKKIASDRSRGLSGTQKAQIQAHVDRARKLYNDGDDVGARKELEAVLNFDSSYKDASLLLKQVTQRLSDRTSKLKQEAFEALSQNDLRTAVIKYRRVLDMDDTDAQANSRLRALSPRIREEAKKMHREGIDDYVNRDVEKAIQVWEQALELDPADSDNIKRDLSKARKLMELRGGDK